MVTNNFLRSDLDQIYHVVQNTMIVYPKELVISSLREHFSKDSYYRFDRDRFGFANTPDHTDLHPEAGYTEELKDLTTRLFIGESFRRDTIFYPALIIRHGGSNYVPISLNHEQGSVQWGKRVFQDGYGNIKTFAIPEYFILAGAWEGSITIEVMSRSLRGRDDLTQQVSLFFADLWFRKLEHAGLAVKGVQVGGGTEAEDRNDKLFKQTITLNIRSEWRRHVPIGNIIEVIKTSVEFGNVAGTTPVAQNITITSTQTLLDVLLQL